MNPSKPHPPSSLRAQELQARLARGEALQLVDVREDAELVQANLGEGVIHLPLSRSQEWMSQIGLLLDRDREVVVFCHAGIRSWQFGCWLIETQGFDQVWNLQGGIDACSVEVDRSVARY
ncbi:rhodanese-like domain-containing protein [Synechococcus sp. CS-603]|uniref:rhodanese-like domain-containing protein n=1 Tax=Synechococcus sp. CS-603 TaxID=2847981 RepID=UPI00223B123E|nr:rhodanese-like domain-containing protein [Synechococcus sp. CS-603]MCT0201404.1 sulfurtransferase [Synechococcus sp. CS-603]